MGTAEREGRSFFLSYRREDSAGHAGRLADHLLDRFGQGSVFVDVDSIEAGVDFTAEIERAIGGADAVLVVIGPGWLEASTSSGTRRLEDPGDFVRREIEVALSSEVRVVPVLVGGARMPAEAELPPSIAPLARRNAVELLDRRWREDVDALVEVLQGRGRGAVGNLPVQPTPFLGRERELAELTELLRRQEVRVLTLTGPGGIGKTRLAVQVAAKLAHTYPGGAWFVPFAALTEPGLVLSEIARALEIRDATEDELVATIAERIGGRRTLIVLDNLEQLLPAAATPIAELAAAAPSLELIVSSRAPVRIAAEREVPVGTLSDDEAVSLFTARARALDPSFALGEDRTTVAAICERLDRLPLAIELAAARTRLLPPSALLQRLEQRLPLLTGGVHDAPERQRTLRATIAWSTELLSEAERAAFARLGIFSGGWTLDAAEAVCDADLDVLEALVERSLIRQERGASADPRFSMLETIREFALELVDAEDHDLRTRHEDHFMSVAMQARPQLRGSDPRPSFDRLEEEMGNFRAAIGSSLRGNRLRVSLRLVAELATLWEHRGHWREGRTWMETVLARSEDMKIPERAEILFAAGDLAGFQGDMAVSRSLLERAAELAREIADRRTLALALSRLAWVMIEHGLDVERAVALGDEGVRVARELGDPWVLAETLNNHAGASPNAMALLEESLELRRSIEDITGVADSLNNLAFEDVLRENYAEAIGYAEESLELARRLDDRQHVALAQGNLGLAHLFERRPDLAETLFRKNLRLCWEIGDRRVAQEALIGLAGCAASARSWEEAAWLAGASSSLAAEGEILRNLVEVRVDERFLSEARAAIGDRRFSARFEQGRRMSFEQSVARALGSPSDHAPFS